MSIVKTQDGTKLYYSDWGKGRPVVLIHGWPLNGDMWERQATFLAERGLRVITYDRRGFGQSSQTWDGYDYDTFAADLHAIMEALDLRGAALIGFSMGGGEVVRYLSRYGADRVTCAVLVSSVTPFLLKTPDNPDGIEPNVFGEMDHSMRQDRFEFLKGFGTKFFGRTMVSHTVSEAVLEWTQSMALTGSLRSTLAAAKAWATTDFRDDMAKITIPVRVIHGTGDETVPIALSGRRSARLLPNATLSEYDGEPHGLMITSADRLNEELLAFINGDDVVPAAPPSQKGILFL